MYSISTLDKESRDFILRLTTNNRSRTKEVSIALGYVLAYSALLPSSKVEDAAIFYKTQSFVDAQQLINTINELSLLDVSAVADYAVKFYMHRYNQAQGTGDVLALNKEFAIPDFFQITRYIDKATLACIQENPGNLTEYIIKFKKLIANIKG